MPAILTTSSATYLMNDIPRGVSSDRLTTFLATLDCTSSGKTSDFVEHVQDVTILDSRLDDELSVATITFHRVPSWFKNRDNDPYGFPKKTKMGTIWKGIDMTQRDGEGRTAFIRAVIDGNLKLAETLAEYEDTDVNACDSQGMTALHWACKEGLTDLAAFCLSLPGLDTGLKSKAGLTAFDIAYRMALQDDDDAIPALFYRSMFEMDAYDPDCALLRLLTLTAESGDRMKFPQEALFGPCRHGNLALVQALILRITWTGTFAVTSKGETALHLAAMGGHSSIMIVLLDDAGFNINAESGDGFTALQYAIRLGYTVIIEILMKRGAIVKAEDRLHPLLSTLLGATPIATATIKATAPINATQVATTAEKTEKMETKSVERQPSPHHTTLIATNAIVPPVPPPCKETAVIVQVTKLVEEHGGDINFKDESSGLTLLHEAVYSEDVTVVKELVKQGANIEERFWTWRTALEIAEEKKNREIVELLLGLGAKTCAQNQLERAPKLTQLPRLYSEAEMLAMTGGQASTSQQLCIADTSAQVTIIEDMEMSIQSPRGVNHNQTMSLVDMVETSTHKISLPQQVVQAVERAMDGGVSLVSDFKSHVHRVEESAHWEPEEVIDVGVSSDPELDALAPQGILLDMYRSVDTALSAKEEASNFRQKLEAKGDTVTHWEQSRSASPDFHPQEFPYYDDLEYEDNNADQNNSSPSSVQDPDESPVYDLDYGDTWDEYN